jgi:hypothetical protein
MPLIETNKSALIWQLHEMFFNEEVTMLQRSGTRAFVGIGLISLISILFFTTLVSAQAGDREDFTEIFERDVYVIVGSTLRTPTAETLPDAPLFNIAGVNLNITWGAWQMANATATARVQAGGKQTDVRIELTGLIPGGVYSIFYGTLNPDSENPFCPGVERTLPLTSFQPKRQFPDASSFIADASGRASYRGQASTNLLNPLQAFYTVIYHSDGQAYHPLPNHGEFLTQGATCRSSFGEDAMRQLIIFQKFS